MGLITWLRGRGWNPPQRRSVRSELDGYRIVGGKANYPFEATDAGIPVDELRALQQGTVFACVTLLADLFASLPKHVSRKVGETREPLPQHWLSALLEQPNPYADPFDFWQMSHAHLVTWGSFYAEIERRGDGIPIALWPMLPDRTRPIVDPKTLAIVYETVLPDGRTAYLPAARVLHVRFFTLDGINGLSPIGMCRNQIGATMAAEKYGARFFAKGARPSGILEHPGELSEGAGKELAATFEEVYAGNDNSMRAMVLEEGMKWHALGIPPDEAQFLETLGYDRVSICSILRTPPILIGDYGRATWGNMEQIGSILGRYTMTPHCCRWEAGFRRLLGDEARAGVYVKWDLKGLERGDLAARNAAYEKGRNGGWLCVDEIRAFDDLPPLPNGQGRIYLQPLNMASAGSSPTSTAPSSPPTQAPTDDEEEPAA